MLKKIPDIDAKKTLKGFTADRSPLVRSGRSGARHARTFFPPQLPRFPRFGRTEQEN